MNTHDLSVFSSDALPTAPLDIADFPNPDIRRFEIKGCLDTELSAEFCVPDETIQIFGIIDTVPEPDGTACGLAVLAALAVTGRLRRV